VMKRLVDLNHAQNIKSAKRMVERARPVVWDVLEEVITEHPVLLNRAPTLHRLGIQAFEPQLVEGKAIQIHPLVCTAFNADFDGDQMAVHVPLSAEAQAEARILMLSTNNILKPADGKPVTMPTQDMVIGIYWLTREKPEAPGEGRTFGGLSEALMAYDAGELDLQAKIQVRLDGFTPPRDVAPPDGWEPGQPMRLETTLGRCLLNETLPDDYPFINFEVGKKQLSTIVNELAESYPKVEVAAALDALKDAGFHWATRSGVTISIEDVVAPPNKRNILDTYEQRAEKVQREYERGLITDDERRQELIEIWTHATADVAQDMEKAFPATNPVWMMVNSGARGNLMQIRQIAGMRGLVSNPKGETIPRPIKSSFREGLSVLEYFISTHGARKGLADTALRTADSGYLTRRLVDVAQDVIVREEDCGTDRSLPMRIAAKGPDGVLRKLPNIENTGTGRTLSEDVTGRGNKVLVPANTDVTETMIDQLVGAGVESVRTYSVLVCQAKVGVCAKCYGRSLATGKRVDVGEAVGIIAAQSIGEPGTQLTMRTFHTGGVAGLDITHGLPRIQELFEARIPKGLAPISEVEGRVRIDEQDKSRRIVITPDDGSDEVAYQVSIRARPLVSDGDHVKVGQQLIAGAVNPHEVLRILGSREVQL
ncbi:MAG: DNA-directed RNA polymerase subunit beta', partial [Actinobacteria bacterium]|nr:DNA-directed RNA polymerase subunit beta' [Actinomycetota bacterium]